MPWLTKAPLVSRLFDSKEQADRSPMATQFYKPVEKIDFENESALERVIANLQYIDPHLEKHRLILIRRRESPSHPLVARPRDDMSFDSMELNGVIGNYPDFLIEPYGNNNIYDLNLTIASQYGENYPHEPIPNYSSTLLIVFLPQKGSGCLYPQAPQKLAIGACGMTGSTLYVLGKEAAKQMYLSLPNEFKLFDWTLDSFVPCKQLLHYVAEPRWTLLLRRKHDPVVPEFTDEANIIIKEIQTFGISIKSIDDRKLDLEQFNKLLKMVCRVYMKWIEDPSDWIDYFGAGVAIRVGRTARHKREQFKTLRQWLNFSRNGQNGMLCEHIPESLLSDHTVSVHDRSMPDADTPLDELLNSDELLKEEEIATYGQALHPHARNRKSVEQHPRFATYTQVQNVGNDLINSLTYFFVGNPDNPDRSSEKDYQFDCAINGGLLEALLIWIGNTETELIDADCNVTVDPPSQPFRSTQDSDEESDDPEADPGAGGEPRAP